MTYQPLDFRFLARCPPEEGAPHADLCLRSAERAIDHAAAAEQAEGENAIRCWERAAQHFQEAQYRALAAAAALHRAQREAYERAGYVRCGRSGCRAWRRPDELEAIPAGYAKQSDEEENRSAFLQCKEHSQEAA